jgi:hypothetical protein
MKWWLYICSDCDTPEGAVIMQAPDDGDRDRPPRLDFCPGCDSYLSMAGKGEVEVSGRPLVHLSMREEAPPA